MKKFLLSVVGAILMMVGNFSYGQGVWVVDQITNNSVNDFRPRIDAGQVWWWEQTSSTNVIGGLEVGKVLKDGNPAPLTDYDQVFLYDWDVRELTTAHIVSEDYPSTAMTSFYVNDVFTTSGISFAQAEMQTVEGHYLNWVEVRSNHALADSVYQDYDEVSGNWLDFIVGLLRDDRYIKFWSIDQGFITPPLTTSRDLYSTRCAGFWNDRAVYVVTVIDEFGGPHSRFYYEDGSTIPGLGWYTDISLAQIDDDILVFEAEAQSSSFQAYAYNFTSGQLEMLSAGSRFGGGGPVVRNGNVAWFEFEDLENFLVAQIGGVRTERIPVEEIVFSHLDIEGNKVVWAESKNSGSPGTFEIYQAIWQSTNAVGDSWGLYE